MERAETLVAKQDWAAAKDLYEEAIRQRPGDAEALARIAFCERRLAPELPGFEIVGNEFDAVTGLPLELKVAGTGMVMRLAPGGEFDIGSEEFEGSQPVHTVSIKPFYLGKFEVTQNDWNAVMGTNPSEHNTSGKLPVERVSWRDAQEFVRRLNESVAAGGFRLPTEAEWEYAARSGDDPFQRFEMARHAWYRENSGESAPDADFRKVDTYSTHPVGEKEPNRWGFHDMYGNVWEWTSSLLRGYFYDPSDGRESPTACWPARHARRWLRRHGRPASPCPAPRRAPRPAIPLERFAGSPRHSGRKSPVTRPVVSARLRRPVLELRTTWRSSPSAGDAAIDRSPSHGGHFPLPVAR